MKLIKYKFKVIRKKENDFKQIVNHFDKMPSYDELFYLLTDFNFDIKYQGKLLTHLHIFYNNWSDEMTFHREENSYSFEEDGYFFKLDGYKLM